MFWEKRLSTVTQLWYGPGGRERATQIEDSAGSQMAVHQHPMSNSLQLYSEYFGLHARPFSLLPDPDYLFWSASHSRAYAMLEYGLATFAPITVITGEVGAGKTTLIRHLLRSAPKELTIGLVSNAHGDRGKLLHWVMSSLGQDTGRGTPYVKRFAQFEEFLRYEQAAQRHTVIIFDEAQNLSAKMLEELRCYSNINGERDELLQIVLVGQPELGRIIGRAEMVQFAQRVSARFHLSAMPREIVGDYIAHRLKVAGASREIFTPDASDVVYHASRGLPRVINQICDYALVFAYAEEARVVNADLVRQVVAERHLSMTIASPSVPAL
jgi:general secretion pathway protein A